MAKELYYLPFMEFVERAGDPYSCWQEDGFWPDRVDAELELILVWGTFVFSGFFLNSGLFGHLQCCYGRSVPEMERGFGIHDCPLSERACAKIRERFGDIFPRNDERRSDLVTNNEAFFEECGVELEYAMEDENYETIAEDYFKTVCVAHSIPPRFYPNLS